MVIVSLNFEFKITARYLILCTKCKQFENTKLIDCLISISPSIAKKIFGIKIIECWRTLFLF